MGGDGWWRRGEEARSLKGKPHRAKNGKRASSSRRRSAGRGQRRYVAQRHNLWSKYEDGIEMDKKSWQSVTPEAIAIVQAERCRSHVLLDPFCGVGGNVIQFARTCSQVIGVDIDSKRLEMARHNAQIYGVSKNRIDFVLGDSTKMFRGFRQVPDAVFLATAWGGPGYKKKAEFDIKHCTPDGIQMFKMFRQITPNICFFLPRNVKRDQARALPGNTGGRAASGHVSSELVEVHEHLKSQENATMHLKLGFKENRKTLNMESLPVDTPAHIKAVTVYYGNLAQSQYSQSVLPRDRVSSRTKRSTHRRKRSLSTPPPRMEPMENVARSKVSSNRFQRENILTSAPKRVECVSRRYRPKSANEETRARVVSSADENTQQDAHSIFYRGAHGGRSGQLESEPTGVISPTKIGVAARPSSLPRRCYRRVPTTVAPTPTPTPNSNGIYDDSSEKRNGTARHNYLPRRIYRRVAAPETTPSVEVGRSPVKPSSPGEDSSCVDESDSQTAMHISITPITHQRSGIRPNHSHSSSSFRSSDASGVSTACLNPIASATLEDNPIDWIRGGDRSTSDMFSRSRSAPMDQHSDWFTGHSKFINYSRGFPGPFSYPRPSIPKYVEVHG